MTTSDEKILSAGRNIQEKATLIWNVANTLFGAFKPHEYGLVILPMVVVKRFHDCLLPTHQAVLDAYKRVEHLAVKDGFLREASRAARKGRITPEVNSTTFSASKKSAIAPMK